MGCTCQLCRGRPGGAWGQSGQGLWDFSQSLQWRVWPVCFKLKSLLFAYCKACYRHEKGLCAVKLSIFSKYSSCLAKDFLCQCTFFWVCDWGVLWTKYCCCRAHQFIAVCISFPLMGLNQDAAFWSTVPPVISLSCSLSPGRGALICVPLKGCIALLLSSYCYYLSYRCLIMSLFICGLLFICPWLENAIGVCSSLTSADRSGMIKIRLKMVPIELFCSFKFVFISHCQLSLLSGLNFYFFVYFKW